jgi:transporter family-2 protein
VSGRAAAALTVLGGALLALQGRINGDLSTHLGRGGAPLLAAAISFSVGTAALAAYCLVTAQLRPARAQLAITPARWWYRIGGLGGAALVGSSAAAIPVVGVALTSVFVVTGQSAGSMVVDGVGLGPSGRHRLTAPRLGGALLAVGALVVGTVGRGHGGLRPLLLLAVVAAGVLVAGQQAVNGRLQQASSSSGYAALISFTGGTLALVLATAIQALAGGLPHLAGGGPAWLYLGGLGGAAYITLGAACVRTLGVLRLSLASVAGQLVGGLVLDLTAPTRGTHVTVETYLAVVLTVAALVVSGLRSRAPSALVD